MDAETKFEAALDAWIRERSQSVANPEKLTRDQALKALAAEALKAMGLLAV